MNKIMYRIEGFKNTRWYDDKYLAWDKFCQAVRRASLPVPLHIPGDVAGDAHSMDGTEIHGTRNGHGYITLKIKRV